MLIFNFVDDSGSDEVNVLSSQPSIPHYIPPLSGFRVLDSFGWFRVLDSFGCCKGGGGGGGNGETQIVHCLLYVYTYQT